MKQSNEIFFPGAVRYLPSHTRISSLESTFELLLPFLPFFGVLKSDIRKTYPRVISDLANYRHSQTKGEPVPKHFGHLALAISKLIKNLAW